MTRPPKPPGGAMWWQRSPPEGWRFVKDIRRVYVMERQQTEHDTEATMLGWTQCYNNGEPCTLLLSGNGGWGRPRNARGMAIANNDGDYTMRVAPGVIQ